MNNIELLCDQANNQGNFKLSDYNCQMGQMPREN